MNFRIRALVLLIGSALALFPASGDVLPTKEDSRLIPVAHSDLIWNGVATDPDGRIFVCYMGAEKKSLKLALLSADGQATPYPDADWNSWKPGASMEAAFVHVNA